MDTTYWGRGFGLMIIKDALRKKILWRKYVHHETIASYMEGVEWLEDNGFKIYGVVIDGIRGLAQALWPLPVQLCQFHQILTVRHYLTQDPEVDASKELLNLVNNITRMDKESFVGVLTIGMNATRILSMNESETNVSKRKCHHICDLDYAAHILVLNGICLFYGLSMTILILVYRIPTMVWRVYSQISRQNYVYIVDYAKITERNS